MKECDKYDIRTNTWINIAPLPLCSESNAAEVYGNDILVVGSHLPGLYYYSVGKNTFSKIFDLPSLLRKNIIVHQGRAWIYCDFGVYESRRYDLTKWNKLGDVSGVNMHLTQHVRIENKLYYADKAMGKYVFDLRRRILEKL